MNGEGGLIREEGLIKKFNLQTGGLLEGGEGLLELLRYVRREFCVVKFIRLCMRTNAEFAKSL